MADLRDGIVLRVKRKRTEAASAPNVFLLPQKRARQVGANADASDTAATKALGSALGSIAIDDLVGQKATTDGTPPASAPFQVAPPIPPPAANDSALAGIKPDAAEKRVLLLCELVRETAEGDGDDDSAGAAAVGAKRSARDASDEATRGGADVQRSAKRSKIVKLEFADGRFQADRTSRKTGSNEDLDFAIWHAINTEDTTILKTLFEVGTHDVNFQRRIDGVSPLMVACSFCDFELMRRLIDAGADVSLQDEDGFDARARVGFCLPQPSTELIDQALQILDSSTFVYDTYRVKEEIVLPHSSVDGSSHVGGGGGGGAEGTAVAAQPLSQMDVGPDVWKELGVATAWHSAPVIADFELDLDALDLDVTDELIARGAAEDESVCASDFENEDDEHYVYNDYPDDETDEESDGDLDSDASGEDFVRMTGGFDYDSE